MASSDVNVVLVSGVVRSDPVMNGRHLNFQIRNKKWLGRTKEETGRWRWSTFNCWIYHEKAAAFAAKALHEGKGVQVQGELSAGMHDGKPYVTLIVYQVWPMKSSAQAQRDAQIVGDGIIDDMPV